MGEHRRKADGRRVFSTDFKRETVQRIVTGEKTVAELSRELDIAPSVIRSWKRFAEAGATTAVQASEDVVPASQLREAYAKIRELERAARSVRVHPQRASAGRSQGCPAAHRVYVAGPSMMSDGDREIRRGSTRTCVYCPTPYHL